MNAVDMLKQMATERGLSAERVNDLWRTHTAWCDRENRDYGGAAWNSLVDKAKDDIVIPTIDRDDPEVRRRRNLEREAEIAEEIAYAREAISLPAYLASIQDRRVRLEPVTEIEARLASALGPYPGQDPGEWLLGSLHDVHAQRCHPCGSCGAETQSWSRKGRVFYGALCVVCSARERQEHRSQP